MRVEFVKMFSNKKMSNLLWTISVLLLVASCVQANLGPELKKIVEKEVLEQPAAEVQSYQNSEEEGGSSSGIIPKPKFACNPRCACYATNFEVEKFIADHCCTFKPCPQSDIPRHYDRFRDRVCWEKVSQCY